MIRSLVALTLFSFLPSAASAQGKSFRADKAKAAAVARMRLPRGTDIVQVSFKDGSKVHRMKGTGIGEAVSVTTKRGDGEVSRTFTKTPAGDTHHVNTMVAFPSGGWRTAHRLGTTISRADGERVVQQGRGADGRFTKGN